MSTASTLLAPLYVGVVLSAIFLGVSFLQAHYYYRTQTDPWRIKLLVAAVLFFDSSHQAFITYLVYDFIVNPQDPIRLVLNLAIQVFPSALTSLPVQAFLITRVWRFSNRNFWLTSVITLVVAAEYVIIIVDEILVLPNRSLERLAQVKPVTLTIYLISAVGDVLIAVALCALLHRSRTGFQRSDTIINKLIVYAVNTGLITSLCAVASFVTFIGSPHTFIYVTFYFCIGRLYTNSLLATLNMRQTLRYPTDHTYKSGSDGMTLSLRDLPKKGRNSKQQDTSNISIKINTTKEYLIHHREQDHADEKIECLPKSVSNAV